MLPQCPFSLYTLSFAKFDKHMVLSGGKRLTIIKQAIERFQPDLLVTAGWALDTTADLLALAQWMRKHASSTTVITEVHHDAGPKDFPGRSHAMWAILEPGGIVHRFGNQAFRTAEESRWNERKCMNKLHRHLSQRVVPFRGLRLFALCCGEINVLHGRLHPRFASKKAKRAIMDADIVVNPTHDRMGNGGTLDAKRRRLSRARGSRERLYVSCSNWDVSGRNRGVQRPSPTLHTAYRSGLPLQGVDSWADDQAVLRSWRFP